MDCRVTIQATYDYQIVTLDFAWIYLFNRNCDDYIQVYDTDGSIMRKFCGNGEPFDMYSTGNSADIHLVTDDFYVDRGFSLVFTAFHYDSDIACNDTYEFKCLGNDRCIDDSLVCDDKNNCNNASDEDDCSKTRVLLILILIFVCMGIIVGVVYSVYYSYSQKKEHQAHAGNRVSPVTVTTQEDYNLPYGGRHDIAMTNYPPPPPPYSLT
uniref:Inactive serine protease PAMR1-like n=1 Tax=Saccoglossus kowalevskii TaxID=10224 RepID=A0ABM0MQT7_SACKO|nr:PREDICTED: inactive serine protease PAMR1-like [Saccoglossus kowalevskii]